MARQLWKSEGKYAYFGSHAALPLGWSRRLRQRDRLSPLEPRPVFVRGVTISRSTTALP